MTSVEEDPAAQKNQNDPCLFFIFPVTQWKNQISPITKIDLVDIIPEINGNFYFDNQSKSYVLALFKSKWDTIDQNTRRKYTAISKRLKEELEGIMTALQREMYESVDLFDLYMQKKGNEEKELLEQDNSKEEAIDLDDLIQSDPDD